MVQSVSIRAWAVMSAHAHCPHPFIGRDSQKWPDMKHLPEFSDLSLQKILDELMSAHFPSSVFCPLYWYVPKVTCHYEIAVFAFKGYMG